MILSRRRIALAFIGLLALGAPVSALAWGGGGHGMITEAAIDNLPAAMFDDGSGNAFNDWREFLLEHDSRPDWIKDDDPMESPRHWMDLDMRADEFPYPFDTIPRDREEYLTFFARDDGVLVWEGGADHWDGLVQAFRARNWNAVMMTAADLGHYVADSAQPLHATANYNGQLTGNDGVHSRYESGMVNEYITIDDLTTRRTVPPLTAEMELVTDLVEYSFETLLQSFERVDDVMAADDVATALDPTQGSAYRASLFDQTGDFTIERLNSGGQRLADLWYSAWVEAGSPNFNPEPITIEAPLVSPVIDGSLHDHTGQSVFQTNTTDTADNEDELDQMFLSRSHDSLVLGVAGNLDVNSSAILLLDTTDGGSSTLTVNTGPTHLSSLSGTQVAAGFEPDWAISVERTGTSLIVHLFNFQAQTHTQLGSSSSFAFDLDGGGQFAFDNSNTGGVRDRDGRTAVDSETVRTGIELSLPFTQLGLTDPNGQSVGALALLVSRLNGDVSNQTLPGMPLGEFEPAHPASETDIGELGYAVFSLEDVGETPVSGVSGH